MLLSLTIASSSTMPSSGTFAPNSASKHLFSSLAHPQSNGQAEAINNIIKRELKLKLEEQKDKWTDDLPEVLWSYRTTPRGSIDQTPFTLAFGSEAVVPVEVGMPTACVENFDEETNNEAIQLNLDHLEERRVTTQLQLAKYQNRVARY